MHKPVRKAVFPVAGLGTRISAGDQGDAEGDAAVVDKPLIHYAVEEAKAAGIEEFFFVTEPRQERDRGPFRPSPSSSRRHCASAARTDVLEELEAWLPEPGQIAYTRQQTPARPRPRGVVRPPSGRRRAVRGAARRRSDGLRAALPGSRWSTPTRDRRQSSSRSSRCRASIPRATACSTSSPTTAAGAGRGGGRKARSRPRRRRP